MGVDRLPPPRGDLDALEQALARVRGEVEASRQALTARNVAELAGGGAPGGAGADLAALAAKARRLLDGRRARDRVFAGLNLFGEPAWDIMLDLFVAAAEGRRISVSSAAIAAAASPTTALRWIDRLEHDDLIERSPDPTDRRRSFLALSARGSALVAAALDRC